MSQIPSPPFNEAGREFGREEDKDKLRRAARYRTARTLRPSSWLRRMFRRYKSE